MADSVIKFKQVFQGETLSVTKENQVSIICSIIKTYHGNKIIILRIFLKYSL